VHAGQVTVPSALARTCEEKPGHGSGAVVADLHAQLQQPQEHRGMPPMYMSAAHETHAQEHLAPPYAAADIHMLPMHGQFAHRMSVSTHRLAEASGAASLATGALPHALTPMHGHRSDSLLEDARSMDVFAAQEGEEWLLDPQQLAMLHDPLEAVPRTGFIGECSRANLSGVGNTPGVPTLSGMTSHLS
jgi:hypothetical protein